MNPPRILDIPEIVALLTLHGYELTGSNEIYFYVRRARDARLFSTNAICFEDWMRSINLWNAGGIISFPNIYIENAAERLMALPLT